MALRVLTAGYRAGRTQGAGSLAHKYLFGVRGFASAEQQASNSYMCMERCLHRTSFATSSEVCVDHRTLLLLAVALEAMSQRSRQLRWE